MAKSYYRKSANKESSKEITATNFKLTPDNPNDQAQDPVSSIFSMLSIFFMLASMFLNFFPGYNTETNYRILYMLSITATIISFVNARTTADSKNFFSLLMMGVMGLVLRARAPPAVSN